MWIEGCYFKTAVLQSARDAMAWSIFTSAGNKLKEVARRSPYRAGSSAAFRLPGRDTAANASRRGPNCGPGSRYVHTGNADGRSPNLDGRAA